MAEPLVDEKGRRPYRDDTIIPNEPRRPRRERFDVAAPAPRSNDTQYARDKPPRSRPASASRAPSRTPSRYTDDRPQPPVVILPSRPASRAPAPTPMPPPASATGTSRARARYDDDDSSSSSGVEERRAGCGKGRAGGGYRRDGRDGRGDIVVEDFGPVGRAPPEVVRGERYPSRVDYEGRDGRGR